MRKHFITYIVLLGLFCSTAVLAQTVASAQKPFVVVIDAGHGGKDPGAVGRVAQEKTLNLNVALLLGQMLEQQPGVQVYYTRQTDVFLTLQERADFVNKHNADLFICIHTNSAKSTAAKGAETFVLGIDDDKMAGNLDVAMRENSVMLLEDNYATTYQGFDPSSVDSYIMFELLQNQYLDQSITFATWVQEQFTNVLHLNDRGVRQAGFWVLHKSACPSVLVEMGFVSNPEEERFLASSEGKQKIAQAIYAAFVNYKSHLDRRTYGAVAASAAADKPADEVAPAASAALATPDEPAVEPVVSEVPVATAPSPVYRVQIFSTTRVLQAGDPTFKGLRGCTYTQDGGFYKYAYGEATTYEEALALQREVKAKFADCFIIAFLDGVQIRVAEARAMQQ